MKFGDLVVAIGIIAIVIIIIIPVPTWILDILLSLNISLSLLLLLISMYTKDVLEISVFPSLLLISTVYRLALNISTTRSILKDGDAGRVIEAFGQFVIQGDVVVGFIVFLIIVIVQFVVITKGSERVSEVAARFTLDAMPGKQMAIDADLNSGLITEEEARDRRKDIQRYADFYGAMDGSSKFVKGDAIAGLIITFINIGAGFIIGMVSKGMPFNEALSKYTLLTVGDGLVSQIPALLISTSTGLVVTRAASESNLGQDLIKQLFGNDPKLMFVIAGVLALLGIFTPLPTIVYIILASLFVFLGYSMRKEIKEVREEEPIEETEAEELRKPENVMSLLRVDDIELEFGYGLIPLADANQGGDLLDRIVMIRRQIAMELGLVVPIVRLRDNIQLNPNEYIIKIKGVEVSKGEVLFDHYLAMNPGMVEDEIEGIDTVEPAFGLPAKWIVDKEREKAEVLGYTVVDPPSVIATHLTEIIKERAHELIGRQDVKLLIDNVKEDYPAVVEELVPNILSIGDVQKVLSNLLREQISIRDMVTILETLADYGSITKDIDLLTEYVRQKLSGYITNKYVENNQLKVITLDSGVEELIMNSISKNETGSYLSIEPNIAQKILNNTLKSVQSLTSIGEQPIILTAPIVRLYFKRLTEQITRDLVVLSYNEIEPSIEVQSLGMVKL
ncbi:flagellar biosynthesis protein FlhA [Anaerosalibacter bizertensis]|uniref:Flagellar biosynthesis protein FlhA n=1 Tax=Anaerosalibacter bizertensis TaxID=932217 RepID=A0A9Q4FKJ4_9FIRM|nr:flagellar biosynthesis protein FlhA [Anaerosalibacter bizertensis]MBV1818034.1 flagellar biosynthesis protein FlhA [Bacteroidales bacterium MSK.15.36]MBU5293280.1 flagellar biosynthesis protein FlhA [Anaerosalibacter bizertensis]MCB5558804.1 flagellar biosynthesis protein FlhA [Anaerosalibacter bizertensis]MCG4564636.1 flagellar biosynthesis protein FlhA [Anaerosalibacter bizertensis]MCG4582669.1 flagellar biosynthesis protein FlhA [Anaerosalibacter bizertensis]